MTKPDTPKEARFRTFVRGLLSQGIKPTPLAIKAAQGDEKFSNGNELSGSLSVIRIEEFERAGWVVHHGRWVKP